MHEANYFTGKKTTARAACAMLVFFVLAVPLLAARAEGLPLLAWGDKTVAVFFATDDQSVADMRVESGERMIMAILIGFDFVMTEESANAVKSEILLMGEDSEYRAKSVFLAEADAGDNPDLEIYFAVPEEQISTLILTFDGNESSVALKDAPRTISESLGALVETFSPSDVTLKSMDSGEAFSVSLGGETEEVGGMKAKTLTDIIKSDHKAEYVKVYEFLKDGGVFTDGVKDETARGLQHLINELGGEVKVDGKVGAKTLNAALGVTRGYLGAPDETSLSGIDREAFESMLLALLISEDEATANLYLTAKYGEEAADEAIRYYAAAAAFRDGRYYTAYKSYFELKKYLLSEEYAAACIMPWPENGEIKRNEAFAAKKCTLKVEATLDEGMASCVKIRSAEGEDVSTLFINSSGEITVKLPGGDYIVMVGTGKTWFGEREAFGGEDAYYAMVYAENDEEVFSLKSDFSYTLTLKSATEEGDLDSSSLDFNAFIGD